jgi:hypothetical protein
MMARMSGQQVATLIWAVLVAATLATWMLARSGVASPLETVGLVMAIAAFKARLIVLHFMGLKHAPLAYRLIFEGWILAVTGFTVAGCVIGIA